MTATNTVPSLLEAALDYARRGWPVFPCSPATKRPLIASDKDADGKKIRGTGGVSKASTDEAQVRAWWTKWPRAMIGVSAGRAGLLIVDFDPRDVEVHDATTGEVLLDDDGKPVMRRLELAELKAALEEQMGCPLPSTLAVRTRSGGVHLYFRMPDGAPIGNRGNLPDHIDVRGLGGYVIVPPSRYEGDGSEPPIPYRWLRDDATAPIADMPDALVAILRDHSRPDRAEHATPAPVARAPAERFEVDLDEAHRRYALRALDDELAELAATPRGGGRYGGRNAATYHCALILGGLVQAGALRDSVVRSEIEAIVRTRFDPADAPAKLEAMERGFANAQPRDLSAVGARTTRGRASGRSASSSPREREDAAPSPTPPSDGNSSAGGRDPPSQPEGEDAFLRRLALLPQTDLGNLQRFLERHGGDFLYAEAWGWLAWDTRRWSRDMALALLGRAVQRTMRAIQQEADAIRDTGVRAPDPLIGDAKPTPEQIAQAKLHEQTGEREGAMDYVVSVKSGRVTLFSETVARWGRTSESAAKIGSMAGLAEPRLAVRTDAFDVDPLLLCVGNGTLVFTRPAGDQPARVERREHRREDRITKIAGCDHLPDAVCPIFDAFMAEVQPADDMRDFLDTWAGYGALGLADAQKMAIFYGTGANGKGVWVNTIAHLLGDYAWAASIDTFMDAGRGRKGGESTPDLAALVARRFVYANEPEEGGKFADGLVKALTSDEPIGGVRENFKSPFELPVTFSNTVSANHRPKIGTDHGIQRRVQIVPWDVTIPDARMDLMLKTKLRAEASGILNHVIRGALAYLTGGLPMPEAVREATREYHEDNDILGQFLALCVRPAPGETVGSTALHQLFAAWQTWAQQIAASGKPWSAKYLNAQMQRKGYVIRKSSTMLWDDIATRYDASDFLDHDGRPVTGALPRPRGSPATSGQARPPGPSDWSDDDDMPL